MSDNIRPALYDAKYEAVLANRPLDKCEETVSVAGKCCESGDMLIWDLPLPKTGSDDLWPYFALALTVIRWQITITGSHARRLCLSKTAKMSLS